jgi:DNA-binding response OmpR family regulator
MAKGEPLPRVLIVDDEPGFARVLGKRLRLRGFACDLAPDGESGLASLGDRTYLAVLLDLRLPDLPGSEVLRRLKAREPDLPVFIITAHGTEVDREECMAGGAEHFFTKPVDVDEIARNLAPHRDGVA